MYEERLQPLESADRAGFFCYHLAEHHLTPLGMGPSPNVFLAALAMRTKQIHMGPLVYLPLYHPVRLVEEICMLDNLSGGRLEIGVGRGVSSYELAHMNMNFLESRAIFEDSLKAIVKGLRERKIVHQGEYHWFHQHGYRARAEAASESAPSGTAHRRPKGSTLLRAIGCRS
jgi:alkanesulfonate monooxygenase SsuD/methylene tetrahydromethanopterin reductase-like flavin-dependent oxidoreductase (luciferase family)